MAKKKKLKSIKAIVALCEGKTDVAFLRRLLELDNYKDYKEIVANIPSPLGFRGGGEKYAYFSKKLKTYNYDSSKLRDRPILPLILRRTHEQSDTFILLYDMNGMNKESNYKEIIHDFQNLSAKSSSEDFEITLPKMDVALAFIYDIDDKSKRERIEFIQNTFTDSIAELQYLSETRSIIDSKYFKGVGYHFLCEEDNEQGNLEDLILPLMKKGKAALFEKAEEFLNTEHEFTRYKKTNPIEKDDNKTASDLKKSLIGAVGQIEISGLNNADIIKHTKLLDNDKLKNSTQCNAILEFIKDLRNKL